MQNIFTKIKCLAANSICAVLRFAYRYTNYEMMQNFKRSMPYADTVLRNRWDRAKTLGFGDGASIYDNSLVFGDVNVGSHTWVGPNVILDGSAGSLTIGNNCSISSGVHIYTHDTVLWAISNGIADKRAGKVVVGDNCYIGSQSIILPDVTIGNMSLIGANSLVNKNVPARTIVAGNPAKIIGYVEGDGKNLELKYKK